MVQKYHLIHSNVLIFIVRYPDITDDLVNSYHLLLCCVDLVFANVILVKQLKNCISLDFSGKFTLSMIIICRIKKNAQKYNFFNNERASIFSWIIDLQYRLILLEWLNSQKYYPNQTWPFHKKIFYVKLSRYRFFFSFHLFTNFTLQYYF